MKQLTNTLLILTFLLLLINNLNTCSHREKTENNNNLKTDKPNVNIEIGNCYIYKYISSDPFYTPNPDTLRVIDVKDNYVKYKQNNGYTSSRRIRVMAEYSQKTDSCNCL